MRAKRINSVFEYFIYRMIYAESDFVWPEFAHLLPRFWMDLVIYWWKRDRATRVYQGCIVCCSVRESLIFCHDHDSLFVYTTPVAVSVVCVLPMWFVAKSSRCNIWGATASLERGRFAFYLYTRWQTYSAPDEWIMYAADLQQSAYMHVVYKSNTKNGKRAHSFGYTVAVRYPV